MKVFNTYEDFCNYMDNLTTEQLEEENKAALQKLENMFNFLKNYAKAHNKEKEIEDERKRIEEYFRTSDKR